MGVCYDVQRVSTFGAVRRKVKMGRAIFTFLCLWSCIVIVTPLTDTEVYRATKHIKNTLTLNANKQYAYVAVLSTEECKSLSSNNNNLRILLKEKVGDITNALNDDKKIYIGSQMVLATFKSKEGQQKNNIHSEYRLLFPAPGSNVSPVQQLLNTNSNAACALFYSLNSPCVGVCTNMGHADNVISKLPVFNKFDRSKKAFVYSTLYLQDISSQKITKENIWAGLTQINNSMDVYRCFSTKCLKCFEKNKPENKGHCINN